MNRQLLAQLSLKWNPFAPDVPVEALRTTPALESFCFRVEQLAREGGFARLTGDPGTGKSAALRLLVERLGKLPELTIGILTRPQCSVPDFYREMGDLFGVSLSPHNRWAGTKTLRSRWAAQLEAALFRPVLVIDEAQEIQPIVLNELRLMSSTELDSRLLLTVVLAGDQRLLEKLHREDLRPLDSRMRVRLNLEPMSSAELAITLRLALAAAGNPKLMTDELIETLCDHATGNLRALMSLGAELLDAAIQREVARLDEKLFLEVVAGVTEPARAAAGGTGRRKR